MTQDPKTKNYMIVLSEECKICDYKCNSIYFQQDFENWTSGNDDIDKFIHDTQLSVHVNNASEVLEWIPYDRFYNIEYIERIGIYKANWIGSIIEWNNYNQNWKRNNKNMPVALRNINNPKNVLLEFKDQVLFKEIMEILIFVILLI
jgi:hypothetical protein